MPRDRMLRLMFWDDQSFMENTKHPDRLLFMGLWNYATDIGVLEYRIKNIKKWLFYYDDEVGFNDIKNSIRTLAKIDSIVIYKSPDDNRILIYIKNFSKHQVITNPSNSYLPRPDGSRNYTREPKKINIFYDDEMEKLIDTEGAITRKPIKPAPKTITPTKHKLKDKKDLTSLQVYMLFFKEFIGVAADDVEWDRIYYKKYVRDVTALLKYLEDASKKTGENVVELAIKATREIVSALKNKGLSWSLQKAVMMALPAWKVNYYKRAEQAKKYTVIRKKEEEERIKLIEEASNPETQKKIKELLDEFRSKSGKGRARIKKEKNK